MLSRSKTWIIYTVRPAAHLERTWIPDFINIGPQIAFSCWIEWIEFYYDAFGPFRVSIELPTFDYIGSIEEAPSNLEPAHRQVLNVDIDATDICV